MSAYLYPKPNTKRIKPKPAEPADIRCAHWNTMPHNTQTWAEIKVQFELLAGMEPALDALEYLIVRECPSDYSVHYHLFTMLISALVGWFARGSKHRGQNEILHSSEAYTVVVQYLRCLSRELQPAVTQRASRRSYKHASQLSAEGLTCH